MHTQVSVQLLMYICVYVIVHVCMHMACVQSEAKESKKWPQEITKGQKKKKKPPISWDMFISFSILQTEAV